MKLSSTIAAAFAIVLLLVNAMVLVQPVRAMSCSVTCPDGTVLDCPGATCQATGMGCSYQEGLETIVKECDPA